MRELAQFLEDLLLSPVYFVSWLLEPGAPGGKAAWAMAAFVFLVILACWWPFGRR